MHDMGAQKMAWLSVYKLFIISQSEYISNLNTFRQFIKIP